MIHIHVYMYRCRDMCVYVYVVVNPYTANEMMRNFTNKKTLSG